MAITPHPRGRHRLGVSRVKESTFGAGQTIAYYVDVPPIARITPQTLYHTNRELANGVEGATKQIIRGKTRAPVTIGGVWASTDFLLWQAAFAMGDDTVDASGTNRTHAITMAAWDGFPGSFSIEQHLKGDTAVTATDIKNNGCVIDSFTLNGGRDGWLTTDTTISGGGQSEAAGNFSGLGNLVTNFDYFENNKVRISIQAAAGEGDSSFADAPYSGAVTPPSAAGTFANDATTILSEAIESWSLTYTNPWQWMRAGGMSSGAGAFGTQPVLTRARSAVLSLNIVSHDAINAFLKALANSTGADNAEYMIVIEGVSDVAVGTSFRSFAYVLPLAMIQSDPDDGGGDIDGAIQHNLIFEAKEDTTNSYKLLYAFFESGATSVFNQ